jgi:deoxyribodipyrimidine photolyase-like uncharacterized protein
MVASNTKPTAEGSMKKQSTLFSPERNVVGGVQPPPLFVVLPHAILPLPELDRALAALHENINMNGRLSMNNTKIRVCIVEEPCFFYDRDFRDFRTHKVKLAFLRAACRAYHKCMLQRDLQRIDSIAYVPFDRADQFWRSSSRVYGWPLLDATLQGKLKKLGVEWVSIGMEVDVERGGAVGGSSNTKKSKDFCNYDPRFLLADSDAVAWMRSRGGGSAVQFSQFYRFARSRILPEDHWLQHEKSHDRENRLPWPSSSSASRKSTVIVAIPPPYHEHATNETATRRRLVAEAVAYTMKHFPDHPGPAADAPGALAQAVEALALTHDEAQQRLFTFVAERLSLFGPYQDSLHDTEVELAHANIAYLLNCGLLTPRQVLDAVCGFYSERNKNDKHGQKHGQHEHDQAQLRQSVEAFVRQLLGWREYMRAIYAADGPDIMRHVFSMSNGSVTFDKVPTLPPSWYGKGSGGTGIAPLDNEIAKALRTAYAHHTVRLMVFLNIMLLKEYEPGAMLRWFMEVVSLDAYEWVMVSNIAAMGYLRANSRTQSQTKSKQTITLSKTYMRKPYWCSSNYAHKMSGGRYARDAAWDALFRDFLLRREKELQGGERVYLRNIKNLL